jgi:trigger factor
MTLTITLSLRPSVVIADYREIKLSRPETKVSEEEVAAFLQQLRADNAELSPPLERASELGDVVTVLFHKERPPVVKERRAQMIIFQPEEGERFNTEQLAGHKPGDEADITISYPEDYPATALAGKTVAYPVKIEEIRQRMMPELDDQFANDLGAENLDDLRHKIKQELTAQKEAQVEENLLEQAWRSVLLGSSIDISESMVKRFMENSLAEGAQMPPEDNPAFKEFHDYTLIRLKDFFLTDAVIANEGIKVEPEELKKERNYLLDLVKHKQITADEVPNDEELEARMLRRKARERIKERVKIA